VVRALLYLPDAAADQLAATPVAGRTLAVRVMVAALRAGASRIAVPTVLRDPAVDRALHRMPELASALEWLDGGQPVPADDPAARWLLLPASALIHATVLEDLLAAPAGRPVVLAASADGLAPVALLPAGAPAAAEPAAHWPTALWPTALWKDAAAGRPIGLPLSHWLREAGAVPRAAAGPYVDVRDAADLRRAETALDATLSIPADSGMDRYLHRRGSRWITRLLVRTDLTPNQVSLASLAIGLGAIWCFWRSTPTSAFVGVVLYALACIVDHADGELARLTFQESRFGASLDWTIDTIIHAGIVLGIGVTAGGPVMLTVGLVGAAGVTLSAVFARYLPHEIEIGPTVGGVLRNIANRDLFYLLLLGAATLRLLTHGAVGVAAVVVAVGSQAYWVGCLARIRRLGRGRTA
jgi:1L-myo-inositol 1-phosphate cytidylyltransferase / CDP-L-myo-inositol myo-inositolphosphotransferase